VGGGNIKLTGTGQDGAGYRILAQTNVALPVGLWWELTSGTFSGGGFSYSDTTATNSQRFYRVVSP